MDALELLVDHRVQIDDLFRCLASLASSTTSARRSVLDELIAALDAHLTVKEQLLYVRLPTTTALHVLGAARRKTIELQAVLQDLQELDVSSSRFRFAVEDLARRYADAADAEENVLFPSLCAHLDDHTLREIGQQIVQRLHGVELAA